MRSSKQRQRNKQNRPARPTGGNVINRVFDSSGPEGKVRGTPAQIIEKYAQLHRDAQLSGDRVNAENFAQHAEHYTRMLAEAQRDVDRAREEQEQFQRDRQAERDRQFEQTRDRQAERERQAEQGRDRQPDRERQPERPFDQPREARDRPFDARDGRDRGGDSSRDRGDRPRFRADDRPGDRAGDRPADRPAAAAPAGPAVAAEPSFLTQPLFPVLVADPDDDAGADAGLVDTPENRGAARDARGDQPRRDRDDRGDRRPWRDAPPPERVPEPVPADASADDAPAYSAATPGEDGARPGIAAAAPAATATMAPAGIDPIDAVAEAKPRRARRPRQPRAEATPDAAPPDAAE